MISRPSPGSVASLPNGGIAGPACVKLAVPPGGRATWCPAAAHCAADGAPLTLLWAGPTLAGDVAHDGRELAFTAPAAGFSGLVTCPYAVRSPDGHAHPEFMPGGAPKAAGNDPQLAAFRAATVQLAERAAAADGNGDGAVAVAARPAPVAPEPCYFERVSPEARELVYAQIGFVNALRCHLRRQDPIPEITPFFRRPVIEALHDEQNVPSAILAWVATRLRRLLDGRPDDTFRLVALDETLSELTNLMGACERIKNTPIPRQYDFLPRVMVRAYLVILPLGMVRELALLTPLVSAVIAFLFLSLDQIGRNVEAPFENDIHDTPMTALCRTIEINLRQMLGETELPPPVQPVNGFLY